MMRSGVSLRVMILAALTVPIIVQSPETFTLMVPNGPILTWLNSTVSLTCELSPLFNAEPLEVRWYRAKDFDSTALLYKDHKIQEASVDPHYRGRVSLTGELERGNVSLTLERVTLEDRGEYVCYVSSEQWYDKAIVLLTVNVTGSEPVLSVAEARGGGGQVNITCSSEGWSPQPTLTWRNKDGTEIRHGQVLNTTDSQGLLSVSSWLLYSPSDSDWLSCTISLSGEKRESRIMPRAPMEGHWSLGAFMTLLFINLLVIFTLIGLFIWNKKTGSIRLSTSEKNDNAEGKTESNERPAEEENLLEEGVKKTDMETETQTEFFLKESATQTALRESFPKVDITLDPRTAHSSQAVSCCKKMVHCKKEGDHASTAHFVLSENKFSSGQIYWEVVVDSKCKQTWYVGVTTTDAAQINKAIVPLKPENGFWVLRYKKGNGYCVSTDPPTPFSGNENLETLGVFLDCDRQIISFYDADSAVHLYSFADVSSNTFAVFSPGFDTFPLKIK
ncbi:butyrophilin subfamily 3 member A1-like [Salmo trutta]|uniref:Butyrophilin subfamily 3 member A1-like n=1 Tax=Salmo trutta TaxID=8032 RepID=A0A673Y6Q3_SALTR|nr:butyrophilin subfamily 3 member A1-like [Salmo trutta]